MSKEDKILRDYSEYSCCERSQQIYNNFGGTIEARRWYQHDIDQIVYSTYFRKMQRKHQLVSEKDPRCRSRMVHTLEVARIAKEISEKLDLDVELTEAIALSHDIGNSAYGNVSNKFLERKTNGDFKHEEAGYLHLKSICRKKLENESVKGRIISSAPDNFQIINVELKDYFPYVFEVYYMDNDIYYTCICNEILDGVRKHGTNMTADTLEGQVVNFADNIAYLSQDIDDLISIHIMEYRAQENFKACQHKELQLKKDGKTFSWKKINNVTNVDLRKVFSTSSSERIGTLIKRFVEYNSSEVCDRELIKSQILGKEIPVLKMDEGLRVVVDFLWEYIPQFYENTLIYNFNELINCKMNILWEILSDPNFTNANEGYKDFNKRYNNPVFQLFFDDKKFDSVRIEQWEKAFFISSLSCDEIDLIIDMYQQRDYNFKLEL